MSGKPIDYETAWIESPTDETLAEYIARFKEYENMSGAQKQQMALLNNVLGANYGNSVISMKANMEPGHIIPVPFPKLW